MISPAFGRMSTEQEAEIVGWRKAKRVEKAATECRLALLFSYRYPGCDHGGM